MQTSTTTLAVLTSTQYLTTRVETSLSQSLEQHDKPSKAGAYCTYVGMNSSCLVYHLWGLSCLSALKQFMLQARVWHCLIDVTIVVLMCLLISGRLRTSGEENWLKWSVLSQLLQFTGGSVINKLLAVQFYCMPFCILYAFIPHIYIRMTGNKMLPTEAASAKSVILKQPESSCCTNNVVMHK